MRYYSTRGETGYVTAAEAIMKGLAPDGGLYVPTDQAASFTIENLPTGSYQEIAYNIFKPYLTDFSPTEIEDAINAAYNTKNFDHLAIAPLHKLSDKLFVLELWHGPTYAFKDIALQILPHLLTTAMQKTGGKTEIIILTATSGDTGKSALAGFRDIPGIKIIVYFPKNGVSEVQKLQMTTQEGNNVMVAAVEGNFDDIQTGIKQIFSDHKLAADLERAGYRLSSANSINWGRLLPQIVYYFSAYNSLIQQEALQPGEKINFVVPTGNFGNILAGYYARQLGLPINRLICAANRNNVLTDFINSGIYDSNRPLYLTPSPSMDILISSNLERLLFELTGHDSERLAAWMQELKKCGKYQIDRPTLQNLQELFWSDYADDDETLQSIAAVYKSDHYLIDTHTAVGKAVLAKYLSRNKDSCPTIILSTASPFKFTGSVIKALFSEGRFEESSELELLKILAFETGTTVPANLADLDQKSVKHKQVIARETMLDHLLSSLNPGWLEN